MGEFQKKSCRSRRTRERERERRRLEVGDRDRDRDRLRGDLDRESRRLACDGRG